MTRRKVSFLQGVDGARYQLPAEDARLNAAALWTPGATGLLVRGGAVPGPGSPALVTAASGGVNIAPASVVVQGTTTTVQGAYTATWDASEFRSAPASSASTYRRILVVVHVYDRVSGGATEDNWDLEVVLGDGASTLAAAVAPPTPPNSYVLATGSVAPDGVVTVTPTASRLTVARGGVLPVPAADTTAGAYVGQYRDRVGVGLERWDGAAWASVAGAETPISPRMVAWATGWTNWDAPSFEIGRVSRDSNGLVTVAGLGRNTDALGTAQVLACTLPVGCRPRVAKVCWGHWGPGGERFRFDVQADGRVMVFPASQAANQFWDFTTQFFSADATVSTTA
jgi:hypothetical protein